MNREGQQNPQWYTDMMDLTGVNVFNATISDVQRYLKCNPRKKEDCNDNKVRFQDCRHWCHFNTDNDIPGCNCNNSLFLVNFYRFFN